MISTSSFSEPLPQWRDGQVRGVYIYTAAWRCDGDKAVVKIYLVSIKWSMQDMHNV